jgi:hypothetical protein
LERRCLEIEEDKKSLKAVIVDSISKIMIIFRNGLLKMKRSITSKNFQSQKKNSNKKKID